VRARSIVAFCCAGLLVVGAIYGAGYILGTRAADTRHAVALATIESERAAERAATDRSMEQLRLSLGESQGRVDSIGRRLSEAVAIAGRATDRSERIKVLIDGIDAAIRTIREGAHD